MISSDGRAFALQARGHWFETSIIQIYYSNIYIKKIVNRMILDGIGLIVQWIGQKSSKFLM